MTVILKINLRPPNAWEHTCIPFHKCVYPHTCKIIIYIQCMLKTLKKRKDLFSSNYILNLEKTRRLFPKERKEDNVVRV